MRHSQRKRVLSRVNYVAWLVLRLALYVEMFSAFLLLFSCQELGLLSRIGIDRREHPAYRALQVLPPLVVSIVRMVTTRGRWSDVPRFGSLFTLTLDALAVNIPVAGLLLFSSYHDPIGVAATVCIIGLLHEVIDEGIHWGVWGTLGLGRRAKQSKLYDKLWTKATDITPLVGQVSPSDGLELSVGLSIRVAVQTAIGITVTILCTGVKIALLCAFMGVTVAICDQSGPATTADLRRMAALAGCMTIGTGAVLCLALWTVQVCEDLRKRCVTLDKAAKAAHVLWGVEV